MDSEFGKILSLLKQKKLYDDSMIIFLADHGEALGEHGIMGHGSTVYDETTRVPLIIKYPKSLNLKGRVHQLVELADILPTIAALFGQQLKLDGRNLLANGFEKEMDDRFVVSRTGSHYATYGLRWRNWLYLINLFNNHEQLYSLAADPYREIGASQPAIKGILKCPLSGLVCALPQQQRQSCRDSPQEPAGQRDRGDEDAGLFMNDPISRRTEYFLIPLALRICRPNA